MLKQKTAFRLGGVLLSVMALIASLPLAGNGAEARPETMTRWEQYTRSVESRVQAQYKSQKGFMWASRDPLRKAELLEGRILVTPAIDKGFIPVDSALIHHWIGSIYLPNLDVPHLLANLQAYDAYADVYAPLVTNSKLLSHAASDYTYSITMISKTLRVKEGLRGRFASHYVEDKADYGYSVSEALGLRELDHAGEAGEREVPADRAHGYVQKIFTVIRYQTEGSGVMVEIESLTLSRDIPAGMRWFVAPLVQRVSRNVMEATLDKLRSGFDEAIVASSSPRLRMKVNEKTFR